MCSFVKISKYVVNTDKITFFEYSGEWLYISFADKRSCPLIIDDSDKSCYNALCKFVQAGQRQS